MGTILKELEVAGDKGRARLQVLFDTGASRSLIRRDKAEPITTFFKAPIPLRFRLGTAPPLSRQNSPLSSTSPLRATPSSIISLLRTSWLTR